MGIKKLLFLFYLLYTVYNVLVCGTTNLTLFYTLPAIVLIWLFYTFFIVGFNSTKYTKLNRDTAKNEDILFGIVIYNCNTQKLILFALLSLFISVLCAQYYTGLFPTQVFQNLISGKSNYINYQLYFSQANIGSISLNKIPYILLMGFKNIIFVYSFIFIICKAKKVEIRQIIYLLLLAIAHLYFGIARGTNFEFYQLFLLLIYCYVLRQQNQQKKINILWIIFFGLILLAIFFVVLSARGATPNYYITDYILYEPNEFFSKLFPNLSIYYMFLYTYLGFGIYYLATLINKIWLTSIKGFIGAIIPPLNVMFGIHPIEETNDLVNIGVKWIPDAASIMNVIGIFGLLFCCYLIGKFLKKSSYLQMKNNGYSLLFGYFIFVFLVSIPNGHFITFSSEQILIAYTVLRYIFYQKHIKIKI